jgi:DNA-binding NarL/FixJ family response regulator
MAEESQMAVMLKANLKPAVAGKARVLLVDACPLLRERLAQIVGAEPGLAVCGEADDARVALDRIAATRPHLVIIDLCLKNSHGLELLKDIRARHPRLRVLVFSMADELLFAERAIRAGAGGYIRKDEATEEVLRAIRHVLSGEVYLSQRVSARSIRQFFGRSSIKPGSPLERLSDRELEVFQLIGQGRSTREIAETLRLHAKTVETYRSRIKDKLKLHNGTQLAQHAAQALEQATMF